MDAHRAQLRPRPPAIREAQQTIEPLYGDTKHNKGFIRFRRRGRKKARTDFRLLMTAHNLGKVYRHQLAAMGA